MGRPGAASTVEEVFAGPLACSFQKIVNGLTSLIGQFELDRPTGLLLPDGRAIECIAIGSNIFDPKGYDIAITKLLSIAKLNRARSRTRLSISNLVRIDQTWFGRSGGLAPISLPLFQGTRRVG